MDELNSVLNRRMPFSAEAEQSVLGSILINPEAFNEVAGILTADDFYMENHREIYLAMQELYLKNRTIDLVTLIDTLVQRGVYKTNEDTRNYIRVLADIVPSAQNIADYAAIVHNKALLRRLIEACGEITDTAFSEQGEAQSMLEAAEQRIFSIVQGNEKRGFSHIRDVIIRVYDNLKLLATDPETAAGVSTGFGDLDRLLIGLNPSDLVLIGARPGMGKTSFALNIATQAAKKTHKTIGIFSLEMSCEQLVLRILSSEAMIESSQLRSGRLTDEEWTKLAEAASDLSECDILLDDTTGITVTGMKAKLRRVKNLGMVVIDYLQLMQSDRKIDNRVQEVSDISRNLKLLAKELRVPVICCAQLSRATEGRGDKIPMLSDLRDSGAIEQDADIVMFLYRPEYYQVATEGAGNEPKMNTANIIVAKNRHGATGNIEMGWMGRFTRFIQISDLDAQTPRN